MEVAGSNPVLGVFSHNWMFHHERVMNNYNCKNPSLTMPFKDPKKRGAYKREWYSKNKENEIKKVHRRRRKIQNWFREYKSKLKCEKCNENHPSTIDFHHIGKKEKVIADIVHWGYSIETIKKEIGKCQVLCANCHRKVHWKKNNL